MLAQAVPTMSQRLLSLSPIPTFVTRLMSPDFCHPIFVTRLLSPDFCHPDFCHTNPITQIFGGFGEKVRVTKVGVTKIG